MHNAMNPLLRILCLGIVLLSPACSALEEAGIRNPFNDDESTTVTVPNPPWSSRANPLSVVYSTPLSPILPDATKGDSTASAAPPSNLSSRVEFLPREGGGGILRLKNVQPIKAEQKKPNWCWAACAQMVNQFNGKARQFPAFLDQETIANYFSTIDESESTGARFATIARAIIPDSEALLNNKVGNVQASLALSSLDEVVDALAAGEIPLLGMRGHVYAVTGVEYRELAGKEVEEIANSEIGKSAWDFLPVPASWKTASDAAVKINPKYALYAIEVWDPQYQDAKDDRFNAAYFERMRQDGDDVDFVLTPEMARHLFFEEGAKVEKSAFD